MDKISTPSTEEIMLRTVADYLCGLIVLLGERSYPGPSFAPLKVGQDAEGLAVVVCMSRCPGSECLCLKALFI